MAVRPTPSTKRKAKVAIPEPARSPERGFRFARMLRPTCFERIDRDDCGFTDFLGSPVVGYNVSPVAEFAGRSTTRSGPMACSFIAPGLKRTSAAIPPSRCRCGKIFKSDSFFQEPESSGVALSDAFAGGQHVAEVGLLLGDAHDRSHRSLLCLNDRHTFAACSLR